MPDTIVSSRQRPHGAATKLQRVGLEVIVVEDAPGPTDDRVGVDVRNIGEREFLDQPMPQCIDRFEIVDAKSVGRSQRSDDGGDVPAGSQRFAAAASRASIRMALSGPVGTATTPSCPMPSQAAAVRQQ